MMSVPCNCLPLVNDNQPGLKNEADTPTLCKGGAACF